MQQKYIDRIKELSELEYNFTGIDDIYPPTKESIKCLTTVLDIMDDMDMIDWIDPENDIYPDNDGGVIIQYRFDNVDYVAEIDVKENFVILSNNHDNSNMDDSESCVVFVGKSNIKPVKVGHKIASYIEYVHNRIEGNNVKCPIGHRWAYICIEVHDDGLRFKCDDIGNDVFIEAGDAETLLNKLNRVCEICDPDATFCLTEEGKKVLEQINAEENERGK